MCGRGRRSSLIISKPSRAPEGAVPAAGSVDDLGGIEGGAPQAHAELALGAALDLVVQERGQELHEPGPLLDGLALATSRVSRLPDRRGVRSIG
jgi:hypothetical protein